MSLDPEPPDFPTPPVSSIEQAVAVDQAAAHAADPHGPGGHHGPIHTHCENCGSALQGPFCHRCGQHDFDFKQGFGHAFHDALENFFHFDAKLFRNTVTLLFRPGVLSAEFNAGHRVAQMPPLRLYIFVSILFFFVTAISKPKPAAQFSAPRMDAGARAELNQVLDDVAKKEPESRSKIEEFKAGLARVQPAPTRAASPHESAPAPVPVKLKPQKDDTFVEQLLREKTAHALTHQHEIGEAFAHSVPKMLLVCLPFFALYTRFLFRKSGHAYLQHFVIALHFHTFIFLWLLFRSGWGGLAGLASTKLHAAVVIACNAWLVLYPFLMLRRLFANSWKRTIFKTIVLTLVYVMTLSLVFIAAAMIIFATV